LDDGQFHTGFSKETWEQIKADQRSVPIHMLNLIRLHDQVIYSDGRILTGAETGWKYVPFIVVLH
jgi:hypothetical protein